MNLTILRKKFLILSLVLLGVSLSGFAQDAAPADTNRSASNPLDSLSFESLTNDAKPAPKNNESTTPAIQNNGQVQENSTAPINNGSETAPANTNTEAPANNTNEVPVNTSNITAPGDTSKPAMATDTSATKTSAPMNANGTETTPSMSASTDRSAAPEEAPVTHARQKTFIGLKRYNKFSLGINLGVAQLGYPTNFNDFRKNDIAPAFGLVATYYLGGAFALQGDFHFNTELKGSNITSAATDQNPVTAYSNNSFGYSISGLFNLGNVNFLSKKNKIGLYASAGVGMTMFTSSQSNIAAPKSYTSSAVVIPVGLGVKYKVKENITANVGYTLRFIDSDNFDATEARDNTDKYGYTYVGVAYTFGKKNKPSIEWNNPILGLYDDLSGNDKTNMLRKKVVSLQDQIDSININMKNKLDSLTHDTDGDGVLDMVDKDNSTPKGAPVDATGHALDSDNDGIIDLYDRCPFEKGTAAFNGCKKQTMKTSSKKEAAAVDNAENKIFFLKNSKDLTSDATKALSKLVEIMKQNPGYKLLITGYTDADGDKSLNERLSTERAEVVKGYLVKAGVAANRLKVQGLGEKVFLDNNITSAQKQRNRVVTIEFVVF